MFLQVLKFIFVGLAGAICMYFWQDYDKVLVPEVPSVEPTSVESIDTINTDSQSNLSDIRELIPRGYIIDNRVFFYPTLGLLFTGDLKTLEFEGSSFNEPDWSGVIQVFQKSNTQSLLEAVEEAVSNEGVDVNNCDFKTDWSDGNGFVKVSPKTIYEPTEEELFALRRISHPELETLDDYREYCIQNLECTWDKEDLVQANNQKVCSKYVVSNGYHDESFFQYSIEGLGSDTFVYVHYEIGGGDRSWIGQIYILEDVN